MRKTASRFHGRVFQEEPPQVQGCNHPRCPEPGLYRAPKTPQRLNEYYWFCLDHVRDYNRAWNYYQGMGPAEIEAHIRADTVWQRPTWRLGGGRPGRRPPSADDIRDGFGFFAEGRHTHHERQREPRSEEERALAVLDLTPPVTLEEVKIRYKALVKKLHPDANGGDKAAEERLKLINQAYSTLKTGTTFKDGAYPWTP